MVTKPTVSSGIMAEITIDQEPPAGSWRQFLAPVRDRFCSAGDCFQVIEQAKSGSETLFAESFVGDRLGKTLTRRRKIDRLKARSVRVHQLRRKRERRGGGEAFDFSSLLDFAPMRVDCLPGLVQTFLVRRTERSRAPVPSAPAFCS